jgi:hypothetical protein
MCPEPEDIDDTIVKNAKALAKAAGDLGSVEQHPHRDQVEADRYLAPEQATRGEGLGFERKKIDSPGADSRAGPAAERARSGRREGRHVELAPRARRSRGLRCRVHDRRRPPALG